MESFEKCQIFMESFEKSSNKIRTNEICIRQECHVQIPMWIFCHFKIIFRISLIYKLVLIKRIRTTHVARFAKLVETGLWDVWVEHRNAMSIMSHGPTPPSGFPR